MDKWMLRLDSAGQKGPEITLKGILIVVEGYFTAEISTTSDLLLFPVPGAHNPKTLSASSWLQDPTLPRKLAVCPPVPGRRLYSTHAQPLAVCPFPKCSASSCLEGESELFIE